MSVDSRTTAVTILGAISGALLSYLLFTDQGQLLRRNIWAALEDFTLELDSFRSTVRHATRLGGM